MFEVGDRVVCIKRFIRRPSWVYDPPILPQVGVQYVVRKVSRHPRQHYIGIKLEEIREYFWNADYFRKVTDIEEPKRRVVQVPKELEPA